MFNFFRLMMPQIDRERGNYGIKEAGLAKMFSDALLLPPYESERLKHYKNPTKQPQGSPTGDFCSVLLDIIKTRQKDISTNMTLDRVNIILD